MRRTLLLVLAAALLAACGSDDDGGSSSAKFEEAGFDITFEYPGDMKKANNVTVASGAGSSAKATAGVGYSKRDVIIVQRFDLNRAIDSDSLDAAKAELDPLVEQISPGAPSGKTGKTSGFPSIEYEGVEVAKIGARTRLVALFDGDVEYLINCQSQAKRRADVGKACAQVLETVKKR